MTLRERLGIILGAAALAAALLWVIPAPHSKQICIWYRAEKAHSPHDKKAGPGVWKDCAPSED